MSELKLNIFTSGGQMMKNTGEKGVLFYAYRYFVVHSGQISLFEKGKRNIIEELVNECQQKKKLIFEIDNRKHLLIHAKSYNAEIHLFKFCKDFPITKFKLDEKLSDIIESKESNFPYIFVLIDITQQIILLEKKTTVFQTIAACKNVFSLFVETYIHDPNYSFSMDEITDSRTFWANIEDAEQIFELKLNLKSPNLFGGIYETNDFLKKIKKSFNNEETDIKLKNKNGNLTVTHDAMDDPLKYAGSGGGNWRLVLKRKGRTKRTSVSSSKSVKTIEITDFEEEYRLIPGKEVMDKIRSIDDTLN